MKRLSQVTTFLYSRALSVARHCRPLSAGSASFEGEHSHVEAETSSSAITRPGSPQSSPTHSDRHLSSPCQSQNNAPPDENPSLVASDSPYPSRILDSRPGSTTSFQRPTSPTPITSLAHDFITEADTSSPCYSILSDWNGEDEHIRVRWYMADRYQKDTWNAERKRTGDPDAAVTVMGRSPYLYISDAWNDEEEEVQARWHLQDKCQRDTWEYACVEAELKASVPFLKPTPTRVRSTSTFSLQAASEVPLQTTQGRESMAPGQVILSHTEPSECVEISKLDCRSRTETDVEKIVPSNEHGAAAAT